MSAHTTTFPIARKPHRCLWCKQHIDRGETYARVSWLNEDMRGHDKYHVECYAAQAKADRDTLDWFHDEHCIPTMQRGGTNEWWR